MGDSYQGFNFSLYRILPAYQTHQKSQTRVCSSHDAFWYRSPFLPSELATEGENPPFSHISFLRSPSSESRDKSSLSIISMGALWRTFWGAACSIVNTFASLDRVQPASSIAFPRIYVISFHFNAIKCIVFLGANLGCSGHVFIGLNFDKTACRSSLRLGRPSTVHYTRFAARRHWLHPIRHKTFCGSLAFLCVCLSGFMREP